MNKPKLEITIDKDKRLLTLCLPARVVQDRAEHRMDCAYRGGIVDPCTCGANHPAYYLGFTPAEARVFAAALEKCAGMVEELPDAASTPLESEALGNGDLPDL